MRARRPVPPFGARRGRGAVSEVTHFTVGTSGEERKYPFPAGSYPENMTIGVRHLRAFIEVARARTVTRAAEQLHISQPALSRTLQELERHLGSVLMHRTTHQLELTEAGRAFLARSIDVVAELDDLLRPSNLPHPALRLGHAWAALGPRTAMVLQAWHAAHPERPLELRRVDERLVGLRQRRADVGVLRDATVDDDMGFRPLFVEQRLAVLPAGHTLARRKEVVLADLTHEVLVQNAVSGTTEPTLWTARGVAAPSRTVRVGNTDDWASAIAADAGIGVSTEAALAMYPHPGLTYVPLADAPPVTVGVAWIEPAPPVVLQLVEFLQQHLGSSSSSSEAKIAEG